MKKSELKQLIKEEILAEAKKDKSGLPFALAANIEKYGTPRTPKGAKPVDFTKKQEKKVKKTAEKLKKYIKEDIQDTINQVKTLLQNREGYSFEKYNKKIKDITNGKFGLDDVIEKNKHLLPVKIANNIYNLVNKSLSEDLGNYMFFQNLKSIKQMVDDLLKLDEKMVDGILASGHDWANDHIATSKDDVEEVHNFLMTKKVVGPVGMDEKKLSLKQKKIASAAPPDDKITGADFAALRKAKKK